jgi:hypothetical protein
MIVLGRGSLEAIQRTKRAFLESGALPTSQTRQVPGMQPQHLSSTRTNCGCLEDGASRSLESAAAVRQIILYSYRLELISSSLALIGDLWRFRINESIWTWMAGTNGRAITGVYGTKGVPDPANYPPCREDSTGWYDPRNNELWIHAGIAKATDGAH